jgi:hypothetical protein
MGNRDHIRDPITGEVRKVYVPRAERRRRREEVGLGYAIPEDRPEFKARERAKKNPAAAAADVVLGRGLTPQTEARLKKDWFLSGLRHAYETLGGDAGFAQWARSSPRAFYDICAKLLPVTMKVDGAIQHITISHALPPPNYQPHGPVEPKELPGMTIEVVQTKITKQDILEHIALMDEASKLQLLDALRENGEVINDDPV